VGTRRGLCRESLVEPLGEDHEESRELNDDGPASELSARARHLLCVCRVAAARRLFGANGIVIARLPGSCDDMAVE
jgi:hypothetical protein